MKLPDRVALIIVGALLCAAFLIAATGITAAAIHP